MNTTTLDTVSVSPPIFGKNWGSHVAQFKTAFRAVALARFYALSEASTRAGVALARTIWATLQAAGQRDDNAVQRVLELIVPLIPGARQSWRPGPELPPPT